MKKTLTLVGLSCLLTSTIFSQTFYTADFEGGQPAGWTQQGNAAIPTNMGWGFGTDAGGNLGTYYMAPHTSFAFVNDLDNNPKSNPQLNNDSLFTGTIDLSTYSHVFISYDAWYVGLYQTTPGDVENSTLAASSDGGKTWTTVFTMTPNQIWKTQWVDLSAYAGKSNVKLAFTYTDGGYMMYGMAIDNVNLMVPAQSLDLSTMTQNMNFFLQNNASYTVNGSIHNYGYTPITSMNLNYKVNGGATVTSSVSSINIAPLTDYNYSHGIQWTPTSSGNYTLKIWADNLNGGTDGNHANDTLVATYQVLDSVQVKQPLFEEFNQASCDPCALATPNLDSVLYNCRNFTNAIRYHVWFPGQDFMNQVTQTAFINARATFYALSGVPDAKLDGTTDILPANMRSSVLVKKASTGSPFKLNGTATYDPATNTYSVAASATAYGVMPKNLTLTAVLTIDTIRYKGNQSTESIPQYEFPQVAEAMMPTATGHIFTSAFTSGQTQSYNFTWVKNHAWGANNHLWKYDSTLVNHVVVYIQNRTTKEVYQSISLKISGPLGVNEINAAGGMTVYPNPFSDETTVAVSLKESRTVKLDVYDIIGQNVYSVTEGKLDAGVHTITLDGSSLKAGVYFVRLAAGDELHTQKIILSK